MKNSFKQHTACLSSSFINSKLRCARAAVLAGLVLTAASTGVQAQTPFISEMRAFAFGFCPVGWVPANGAEMQISENEALFSLLGTTYGGNGQSTFGLPDLRGRMPVGQGVAQGVGYLLGQRGGAEATTITISQMPAHTHTLIATTAPATHTTPTAGALLAQTQNGGLYTTASATEVEMTTLSSGSSQPVDIRDPSLAITWCVSEYGVYPPAN